jgi:hypothetical protein
MLGKRWRPYKSLSVGEWSAQNSSSKALLIDIRPSSQTTSQKAVLVIDGPLHLTHFLIVGAGAAGLMAARELASPRMVSLSRERETRKRRS